jgi:PAS domain S-box-containing protein
MVLRLEASAKMKRKDNIEILGDNVGLVGHSRAQSPFGNWEWDFDKGTVTWSDGMFRVLGLEPGSVEPTYDLFISMMHPEDRASGAARGSSAINQGQNIDSEFRIIQPQGVVRWVANKGEVFCDAAGQPSWAAGVLIDITTIREAQIELSAREERYRGLAMANSVGEWRATSQGNTVDAQCWANFTGRHVEDCLARGWLDAIHPKDVAAVEATWDEAVRIGSYFEISFRLQHRSGQYRWVLCKAVPIKREDGPVLEWVGTAEDIQTKRETEELLRVHVERLRLARFEGPMATWDFDLETGQITRSDNAQDVLGIGSETVEEFQSSIHPDDRSRIQALVRATRDSGRAFSAEYRRVVDEDRIVWFRSRVRVVPSAYGGADHIIGVTFNITAQKEAEFDRQSTKKALRELHTRHFALMKVAGDFIWTVSVDGKVFDIPGWLAFTGQRLDQVEGWGWLNAIHPADRERAREMVQSTLDTRSGSSCEYRVRDRSGDYHWFRGSISPVLNDEGVPIEWIGTFQRITVPARVHEVTFTRPAHVSPQPSADDQVMPWQVRAARGILEWSVRELAAASGVSVSTIRRVEVGESHDSRLLSSIRSTLEQAGIQFVRSADGTLMIRPRDETKA